MSRVPGWKILFLIFFNQRSFLDLELDKKIFHSFHSGSHICGRIDAPIWLSGGETADVFWFQAYMDTLQTQWSWILQITKCIDVHLKENAAYFQVFILSNNLIVF